MSSDDFDNQFNSAQWEAEYGDERLRLIKEEEDRLHGDQESIFPKTEPWTVWLHRVNQRGILVRFSFIEEAYSYAVAALYNESLDASVYVKLEHVHHSKELLNIGQTETLQTIMFSGIKVPASVLNFTKEGFFILKPTHALKLGPNILFQYNGDSTWIIEIPLPATCLEHWTDCLSSEAKQLANI